MPADVNVKLPDKASQTVASGLVRGTSAVATSLVTSSIFLGICGAAYFLVRKFIASYRHARLVAQYGTNTKDGLAIAYATRLYTAMISGYSWWNDAFGDGTDEEAMYEVARDMHRNQVSFALVSSKYKGLYDRMLENDITTELSSAEIDLFQRALSTGALNGLGRVQAHFLYTSHETPVFDAQLRALGVLPGNMKLGVHVETLTAPDGHVWLGFNPPGLPRRFVSALTASSLPF